jgi:hypothetical protein
MRTHSLLPLLAVAVTFSACGPPPLVVVGNGAVSSVDRAVPGTTAVALAMPGDLEVMLGDPATVHISAEANLLPYLTSAVSWGELELGSKPNVSLHPTQPIRYVLTVPSLKAISTASLGNVSAPSLTATDLRLKVGSSGSIHLAGVWATTLTTEITSNGDVQVDTGVVTSQTISITSSGNVDAAGLRSATAEVHITSSGHAVLWVTDQLDVTITSSGTVQYYGAPQVTVHLTSSGTVTPLGPR